MLIEGAAAPARARCSPPRARGGPRRPARAQRAGSEFEREFAFGAIRQLFEPLRDGGRRGAREAARRRRGAGEVARGARAPARNGPGRRRLRRAQRGLLARREPRGRTGRCSSRSTTCTGSTRRRCARSPISAARSPTCRSRSSSRCGPRSRARPRRCSTSCVALPDAVRLAAAAERRGGRGDRPRARLPDADESCAPRATRPAAATRSTSRAAANAGGRDGHAPRDAVAPRPSIPTSPTAWRGASRGWARRPAVARAMAVLGDGGAAARRRARRHLRGDAAAIARDS